MGTHVVHFAVVAGRKPALQVLFMLGQVQAADADLLKAQLAAQSLMDWARAGRSVVIAGMRREKPELRCV